MASGEVDFHVFWKYWKLTSSPNTSKLVLGPPEWSSDFFSKPGHHLKSYKTNYFPTNDHNKKQNPENWTTSQNRHLASF